MSSFSACSICYVNSILPPPHLPLPSSPAFCNLRFQSVLPPPILSPKSTSPMRFAICDFNPRLHLLLPLPIRPYPVFSTFEFNASSSLHLPNSSSLVFSICDCSLFPPSTHLFSSIRPLRFQSATSIPTPPSTHFFSSHPPMRLQSASSIHLPLSASSPHPNLPCVFNMRFQSTIPPPPAYPLSSPPLNFRPANSTPLSRPSVHRHPLLPCVFILRFQPPLLSPPPSPNSILHCVLNLLFQSTIPAPTFSLYPLLLRFQSAISIVPSSLDLPLAITSSLAFSICDFNAPSSLHTLCLSSPPLRFQSAISICHPLSTLLFPSVSPLRFQSAISIVPLPPHRSPHLLLPFVFNLRFQSALSAPPPSPHYFPPAFSICDFNPATPIQRHLPILSSPAVSICDFNPPIPN